MKRSVFIILLLVLAIIPSVAAVETEITIYTKPNYTISGELVDDENNKAIKNFSVVADAYGDAKVSFQTNTFIDVELELVVDDGYGNTVVEQTYGPFLSGIDFIVDLSGVTSSVDGAGLAEIERLKKLVEEIEAEQVNEELNSDSTGNISEELEQEEIEIVNKSPNITGNIANESYIGEYSKYLYYGIAAFILVCVIFFIFRGKSGKSKDHDWNDDSDYYSNIKTVKLSDFKKRMQEQMPEKNTSELDELNKKLAELQNQIKSLTQK
jgi:hypothetical protein